MHTSKLIQISNTKQLPEMITYWNIRATQMKTHKYTCCVHCADLKSGCEQKQFPVSSRIIVTEAEQPHGDFEAVNAEPTAEPRPVDRPVGL